MYIENLFKERQSQMFTNEGTYINGYMLSMTFGWFSSRLSFSSLVVAMIIALADDYYVLAL